jgi:hypothetical protein
VRTLLEAPVVHVNSWDYFLPLLASNPHHARAVQDLGPDLAGVLLRFLFRPVPALQVGGTRVSHIGLRACLICVTLRHGLALCG